LSRKLFPVLSLKSPQLAKGFLLHLFYPAACSSIDDVMQPQKKTESLLLKLTANLQQEDLNPTVQAKEILAFIQAKHPDPQQKPRSVPIKYV
jgi:hypothetical protein